MKVSTLIEILQHFSPEEEILVTWWEKDSVEQWLGRKIPNAVWSDIVDAVINNDYCWEQCDSVLTEESERLLDIDQQLHNKY